MTPKVLTCPDPERWRQRIRADSQDNQNGCRVWTASFDRYGYGRFSFTESGGRIETGAHRAAWLAVVGPIPEGMVIDHLCRNRGCVNVDHLEVVTNEVNIERGLSAPGATHHFRKSNEEKSCRRHGRADGYLGLTCHRRYTRWVCRICARAAKARRKARLAA